MQHQLTIIWRESDGRTYWRTGQAFESIDWADGIAREIAYCTGGDEGAEILAVFPNASERTLRNMSAIYEAVESPS
jgi:hypothetical protein